MADGIYRPEPVRCPDCWAREQAAPPEAQLRILAQEDWLAEAAAFIPRTMTQDQAVAAEMLTVALGRFISAYGVGLAGARLAAMLGVLRVQAKRQKITGRILAARASINARARATWKHDEIEVIEAEPTPDYQGKARDDAWLRDQEALG